MSQKTLNFFECKFCDYKSCRNSDFKKHLSTSKHILRSQGNILETKSLKKVSEKNINNIFSCNDCEKVFKSRSGLWKHKQYCKVIDKIEKKEINENILDSSNNILTLTNDLIVKLLNDNKGMRDVIIKQQDHMMKQQEQISELIPKIGNNNNNIQNNKFNIQVFLNEQCKDAINMSDFIKSIQVSFQQLDYTKHNGLVNGLSNVIIENINKLGLYERPIHCTDIKRETLYIKDDDVWCKDVNKQKIKKAIKNISTKQFYALNNWTKENPDFQNDEYKQNYYTHTLVAIANNKEHNEDKIIKKLCNTSYIKE